MFANVEMSEAIKLGQNGMKMARVTLDKKPISFLIKDVTLPFEPSTFNNVAALKKTLLLRINESHEGLEALDKVISERIGQLGPTMWHSAIQEKAQYGLQIKSKINLEKALYYNESKELISQPDVFSKMSVNVQIEIGGAYISRQGSGLLIEVTALQQIVDEQVDYPTQCPF